MSNLSNSRQRTAVRKVFGLQTNTNVPVVVLPEGRMAPRILGQCGGHFTRGGSRIAHPGAYARRGWSNMVYRCSTRRIVVGQLWLAAAGK